MKDYQNIVITDIGSTTTKALLLSSENGKYRIKGIENSPTTVEKPFEDVCIGLFNAVRLLEKNTNIDLLSPASTVDSFDFTEDVCYLTTSSAGGGLQILVIGLSLQDSAGSACRAAFGAGGVILETLAINDDRTAIEQIGLIDLLHPDIILFSGGVEGGAYSSVIRMSEILKVSNPKPKFGVDTRIPLIYAGNIEARDFVKVVFGKKFDLHVVDNIRPTIREENLQPARDEIHRIFMENVMEQAPGYSKLKGLVTDAIIPTPTGVLKSLETFSGSDTRNVIAFDIGGATTDIFSNIFDKYYRTVSANYGMSYSIANVMADAGFEKIRRWLPENVDSDYIRNYICNKMLYPTYLPRDDLQMAIEHAAAREAVKMSFKHHLSMNFNIRKIGHLDRIKDNDCKFSEAMYYEKSLEKKKFVLKDFRVILAAGGIVTGAADKNRIALLCSDALAVDGITELWYDNRFLSPHLGKLSELSVETAKDVLLNEGYSKLALSIKPLSKQYKKKVLLMKITIDSEKGQEQHDIYNEEIYYFDHQAQMKLNIACTKKCDLGEESKQVEINSSVPVIVDTRKESRSYFHKMQKALNLYNLPQKTIEFSDAFHDFVSRKQISTGKAAVERSLPYPGLIYVKKGDKVEPETLLGEDKYEPPRLYIINLMTQLNIKPEVFREGLLVKEGEEIQNGRKIFSFNPKGMLTHRISYDSPVRGELEKINYESGSLYIREVQDYPLKPLKLKVASAIGIKPSQIKGYLKKNKGDFVRTGEVLARNLYGKKEEDDVNRQPFMNSPTTGTITDIDTRKGTVTIQYLRKSTKLYSGLAAEVSDVKEDKIISLSYSGLTISGIIGFGRENYGELFFLQDASGFSDEKISGKVVAYPHKVDLQMLQAAAEKQVKGLIIPCIDNSQLIRFTGKEIGVALTGSEDIPYPLIITEGFGDFEMHQDIISALSDSHGKECFLQTFTQIRAGVTRPKIIIAAE